MYRNLIGLVAVFAAALVLVGITFSSVKEDRADFVFVNGSEPKTLDPQKMTGVLESRLAEGLFEGLTYRNGVSQLPEKGAAMSWDVAPDGRRYVFHMRPEARWTDGTPVTANDFVFAWKRLQEPEIASEYAYLLHGIRHAEAYNTFAAQGAALRGDPKADKAAEREGLIAGLRALVGTPARPLDAKAWQGFVADRKLRDVVIRPVDPVLVTGLDRDTGTFTAEEADALVRALEGDAARREHDLAEAKAHFGVDQGVFAPDAATFVVELVAFVPYFLELTSFHSALPVPRHVVEAHPEDWFRPEHIVSNGPFRMQRWEINRKIRLAKSDTYWGAKDVRLGTVDALPIENNTTALNLYLTDEADWLPATYPPDLVDRLSKRADFRASQGASTYFYRINCTRKPFDDPRIRLALAKAVDRATLVKDVTKKNEPPALTIAAPGVPGYEPPDSKMGFDLVEARRLLAEAGYGPGGKTLEVRRPLQHERGSQEDRRGDRRPVAARARRRGHGLQRGVAVLPAQPDDARLRRMPGGLGRGLPRPQHLPRPVDHEGRQQQHRLGGPDVRPAREGGERADELRGRARCPARQGQGAREDAGPRREGACRPRGRGPSGRCGRAPVPAAPRGRGDPRAGRVPRHPHLLLHQHEHDRAAGRGLPHDPDAARRRPGPEPDGPPPAPRLEHPRGGALMPRRELWTRVAGGGALAFVVWMFAHRPWGPFVTLAVTVAVWALASRFFPLLALRRFLWALPLFALLIFVAIQLMFLAPGDPFASEKNAPEAVRKQQQANYGVLDRSFVGGAALLRALRRQARERRLHGPRDQGRGPERRAGAAARVPRQHVARSPGADHRHRARARARDPRRAQAQLLRGLRRAWRSP